MRVSRPYTAEDERRWLSGDDDPDLDSCTGLYD
jgi:hypothetical protein